MAVSLRPRWRRLPYLALSAALGLPADAPAAPVPDSDPARYVDPFIGTGGHGHTYPGATLPYGMVQLSPDTRLEGWDGCSGYHASDVVVYGFSHTHLSGTGIPDYGDVLLMPVVGTPRFESSLEGGHAARFDKSSERAEPGWYAVRLADGVDVELTATERAGFHRYRYPPGRPAHVVVDLEHRDALLDSSLAVAGEREIEGFRRSTAWAKDQVVYFVARFSRPFTAALSPAKTVGVLSFGTEGGELLVKVGISAVDAAGARRNLDAELPGWDFDAVRRDAHRRWNEELGKVEVEGGSREERTVFYTALYHSLIVPNVFSDVDGRYRGMDGRIHRADSRRHYTVFSLWDTFRAAHPLYTLLERERTRELLETFLAQYREGGRLPVWELAGNETDTMIGYHSVPVLADAYLKGVRGFDADLALEAMVASATWTDPGLDAYRRQGFIGGGDDSDSVSKTLEYAFDDACIARMAGVLGRGEIEEEFRRRAGGWRHLLDPRTGFMRPRRNQRWLEPFDPRRVDGNYTEANAWQYSFFVPHDVGGLIGALGGDEAFVGRLDALFEADPEVTGRDQPDITGLIGQYAHGNEPSHHMAFLYHYAGRPDKSAERVREIVGTLYRAAPDGLSGNEDCGQMSAWYVFAAMGLYPVCPCSPEYVIVPPVFERVRMRFEDGRAFTVRTEGQGPYVAAATLDGEILSRSFLRHDELAAGGELVLTLGRSPGPAWGTAPADRPPSALATGGVIAAPWAEAAGDLFRGELTVALAAADPEAEILYALADGNFEVYDAPLVLEESAAIRFFAAKDGQRSPVVESRFHEIPHDWGIELTREPSPQYDDGGALALIDGLRGPRNWRVGGWHGYRDGDFEATVDLGELREIRRAGAGFLQDVGSWIWMPSEVVVSVSGDGETFREVARVTHGVAADEHGVVVRDLAADLDDVRGRWVRVLARSFGTIPDWHPGRGERAWIFVDEIVID